MYIIFFPSDFKILIFTSVLLHNLDFNCLIQQQILKVFSPFFLCGITYVNYLPCMLSKHTLNLIYKDVVKPTNKCRIVLGI